GDAPAALHGYGRERAGARSQGAHRLALRREPALPAHREAPREGRLARARGGLRDAGRRTERAGFGHGRSPRAGRALMSSRLVPVLVAAGVLLVLASLSLFTVSETEFAIRTGIWPASGWPRSSRTASRASWRSARSSRSYRPSAPR